ncbi:MAG: type II secretion system GspH family protein [Actinobacteria bacterium]|nr:type II secretion system GspH family protein [Actinomycetota bacterium]
MKRRLRPLLAVGTGARGERGFTLVEMLIVMQIIGVLLLIAVPSYLTSQAKARDRVRQADIRVLSGALQSFYQLKGKMPDNNNCAGVLCPGAGNAGACDATYGAAGYAMSMQELVDAGVLAKVPKSPRPGGEYCYYNYGPGGGPDGWGALLVTTLESRPPSTTGVAPSRRWNTGGVNWCDNSYANTYYCIPNIYG